jgi:gliding motility-associated protein GldM
MAGGKETPRQKMIGMMYLVLTALLALNVSKQILDAFVAIEENMQKAGLTHLERGNGLIANLKTSKEEADKDTSKRGKAEDIKAVLDIVANVDAETKKFIELSDKIKKTLLEKCEENVTVGKSNDPAFIYWKTEGNNDPLRPARMNLAQVQAKDNYDIPMAELVGPEPLTPEKGKLGLQLWDAYNNYRLNLCKSMGSYTIKGKTFKFTPTAINSFKDYADLTKQVEAMIDKNKEYNVKEDRAALRDIYIELTKPEKVLVGEDNGEQKEWPWIGKTFDHAPLVAAIASITSLQAEVLSARATAIAHLSDKVAAGTFSFNSIEGFAVGPTMVTKGDAAELMVMMAAFDSDNQPVITGGSGFKIANGRGLMKIPTTSIGDKSLSGTVKIKKKDGTWAERPWSYKLKVIEPTGSISLPDMLVLYRNYPNNVQAVAAGFEKTDLKITSGSATKIAKGGNKWIINPSSGNSLTLAVVGTSSVTKNTATLNTQTFKVKPLPEPSAYLGGKKGGESVNKNVTSIQVKWGPEITLTGVTFPISGWTLIANGRETSGTGTELNAQATNMMKQSSGKYVSLVVNYKMPDKKVTKATATFKVQ